jgi:hypothetical protein
MAVCLASACSSDPAPNDAAVADVPVTTDMPVATDTPVSTDTPAVTDAATDATAATDAATDATAATDAPDPYACIGRVPAPMATATMSTVRVRAINFSNNAGMADLTVRACARTDTTCATPQAMGTTDMMGFVTLTVPLATHGYQGYFEFTGGAGSGAVTPTRLFFNPPVTAAMANTNALLVPAATFNALGGALGGMLDDTRGAITFGVAHCLGAASGAAVAVSPAATGSTAFYNVTGLPDPRAMATDMGGQGGLLNVPPGEYTLTASRVSPTTRIGAVPVTVRGRFVTAVTVVPSP